MSIDTQLREATNESSADEILEHLRECNDQFVPNLSDYVNLPAYCEKLANLALRFELWHDQELIGLIALYRNTEQAKWYVSNVSVSPRFQGMGLAARLMDSTVNAMTDDGIGCIELEVRKSNQRAINFYKKLNFEIMKESESCYFLCKKV